MKITITITDKEFKSIMNTASEFNIKTPDTFHHHEQIKSDHLSAEYMIKDNDEMDFSVEISEFLFGMMINLAKPVMYAIQNTIHSIHAFAKTITDLVGTKFDHYKNGKLVEPDKETDNDDK